MSDPSPKPIPLSSIVGPTHEHCLEMARKYKLIDDQGEIWCIRDGCDRKATMPTLQCELHKLERERGR